MKTPKFWQKKGLVSFALLPFSLIYLLLGAIRSIATKPKSFDIPVICIGNITAGGAGKTPTAIAIAKILIENNLRPCFLSRGYGGSLAGPVLVDPDVHTALQVGDEPLILKQIAPVIVSKKRSEAIPLITKQDFDVVIMDDGLQNPSIKKDLSILVIDGNFGFGNKMPIPSGPLRQALQQAQKRVGLTIIIGEDKHNITSKIDQRTLVNATIKPFGFDPDNKKYIAFAGIANPAKFFITLNKLNFNVIEEIEFADHYNYSDNEIQLLIENANSLSAILITTEKDYVKVSEKQKSHIKVLPIEIEFDNQKIIKDKILQLF